MTQSRRIGARVLAIAAFAAAGCALWVAPAAAAGKEVKLANGVAVTVASGWAVSNKGANSVTLSHGSPKATFSVLAAGKVGVAVTEADTVHLNQFVQGFGLKHVKSSAAQKISTSASSFDQAAQITFSGTIDGQKVVGAAVEYQNSTTGNGAFAAVIGTPAAKTALKKPVNNMFNSVISDSSS